MQGDPSPPAPGTHRPVAPKSPVVAGFLVGMDGFETPALMQALQHFDHLATFQQQSLTQALESLIQISQAFGDEVLLAPAGIRQAPVSRLDHVQRQHRPAPGCLGQWPMIIDAQIALEPDQLQAHAVALLRQRRQRSEQ